MEDDTTAWGKRVQYWCHQIAGKQCLDRARLVHFDIGAWDSHPKRRPRGSISLLLHTQIGAMFRNLPNRKSGLPPANLDVGPIRRMDVFPGDSLKRGLPVAVSLRWRGVVLQIFPPPSATPPALPHAAGSSAGRWRPGRRLAYCQITLDKNDRIQGKLRGDR